MMKVKLIVGFRRDQEHSINANEAHKAYYLFLHPTERGVFSNGLAIKGDQIQEIVPDYQGTMGWNPSHVLDSDDWADMHGKGIPAKMQKILAAAKEIAQNGDATDLGVPLSKLLGGKYPALSTGGGKKSGEMKQVGEFKMPGSSTGSSEASDEGPGRALPPAKN